MLLLRSEPHEFETWRSVEPLAACRQALHNRAFRLRHPLAGHPLFTVDALMRVAQEAAGRRNDLYFDAGDVSIDDRWGHIPVPDRPVGEIIKRIETAGAWIVMKHVERNPDYAAVLEEWAEFVREIAGPEGVRYLRKPEMLVFITSPNRTTPFHFDAEINFLVQISGSKDLWVCDPHDRSITTDQEIERLYTVDVAPGQYKPFAEERATHFRLDPGDAVHIPTHGAHWVRNHDNISVSLSLNFEFPSAHYADVYRANHYLRRLGLTPRSPGRSPWSDGAKAGLVSALRSTKRGARWFTARGGEART